MQVALCTKEGTRLTTIAERENWVWCARPRPKQNFIAVGCEDGSISMYQLIFSTVHGLYQDRYAYRSGLELVATASGGDFTHGSGLSSRLMRR